MNYQETIDYLYTRTPLFQNVGQGAYKEGLTNTLLLDAHLNHPHRSYKTIHIAGTNGKGTCSHTIASILQEAGYKVGLYTSPHLVSLRERIRVNGVMIPEQKVIDFVADHRQFFEPLYPSFFEVVTAMAFQHFAEENIDVAVVEVGLGGRLDCTNIISPVLSLITNISFDHVKLLGNTLPQIAAEKAGIIKPHIPVVIGESLNETRPVFLEKAVQQHAPVIFAEDYPEILSYQQLPDGNISYKTRHDATLVSPLGGFCQTKNTNTILHAVQLLKSTFVQIDEAAVRDGFAHVITNTHLAGRWQQLADHPRVFCDTGHNIGGFQYITAQLQSIDCLHLRIVLGMAGDKDINGVLSLLPKHAIYYFTQASVARALDSVQLRDMAAAHQLHGNAYPTVSAAYQAALQDSTAEDFIFVGGSTFVVADLLTAAFMPHPN